MANLVQWIAEEAGNEPIEAIVIGNYGGQDDEMYAASDTEEYMPEERKNVPAGKILTWDEAAEYLDYDFHDGLGAMACHAFQAWTATKIIALIVYDGACWTTVLPRHPIEFTPIGIGRTS